MRVGTFQYSTAVSTLLRCVYRLGFRVKPCCISTIHRFVKLFDAGEYEDAAFHAARSPHGVLRNMGVMEKFKGTVRPIVFSCYDVEL